MDLSQLHFAHPLLLWSGIMIPLVGIIFFLFYQKKNSFQQLEKFIDSHLLPYLLVNHDDEKSARWKRLLLWSVVWLVLTFALAGPRWSFRETETFSVDQSLVILLDLSESMNTTDVKPSRLTRAKQKIEDLLNLSKSVKIGLVAFAADAHMMTPLTEDKETIRHLLPSLDTNLVYVQGSRLTPAFNMAATMLDAEPGSNKAILVISDGGFEDGSAIVTAKKLAEKGVVIHAMGVGTVEGAFLNNTKKMSRLEKDRLSEISKIGNGRYFEARYADHDEVIILNELATRAEAQMNSGKKNQFWDEYFYLLIIPVLPILLLWFRRGSVFALIIIAFFPLVRLEAVSFKNNEEIGKETFDSGNYEAAANDFQDPYRKGVAYYRANDFAEAEKMFRHSSRPEVASSAAYNLGNCLVQQQKLKDAITVYEDLLKQWPDHTKAKENLEIVKKMLEEQKENSSKSDDSNQQENQEDSDKEKGDSNNSEETDSNGEKGEGDKEDRNDSSGKQDQSENEGQTDSDEQQSESDKENNDEEQQSPQEQENHEELPQEQPSQGQKSQEDQDADLWLNRISNDPKNFLKNKFYIESKNNGTKEGIDPW
ncbi:MAG: VWA domain-containing protein [Parachlamydiaceae bacterium]